MIRAWTELNLRFNAISVASAGATPTFGTTVTTNGVRTRRPPDISISHSTNSVEDIAVAIVAQQESFDDEACSVSSDCASGETCSSSKCKVACTSGAQCDADETCTSSFCTTAYNRPRASVIHRYTSLASNPPSHSSFELDTSGDDDATTSDPRITYVRSLGNSCSSGSCSNGWLLTVGRFLVMQVKRDRTPVFYLSNVGGTAFTKMVEDANGSVPFITLRMIHEGFDIECPTHTTTSGSTDDRDCRVVFDSYRRSADPLDAVTDNTAGGEQLACTIRLGTTSSSVVHFQNLGCTSNSGFGAERSYSVSLTDYGTGAPGSQRTTRGWLLTQSAPSPNEGASVTNSRVRLWDHSGTTLASAQLVQSFSYLLDKITCTAMDGEKAMSYFGGTSLDYAEDAQRIYRLDWGLQGAADVPDDVCY